MPQPTLKTSEERANAAQEIVNIYRPIPHYFVKDILGANTWNMQDEITKSVFKYPVTAVKTCNAVGKSFIAARIAIAFLTLHPGSIVVTTAPTWRQVTDVLWREIATAVKMSKFKLTDKQVTQAGLNLDTDWYAVGLSTKTPENFFGYHADHILVIVDEAGGVPELVFTGVKAITPNANARVLYIGNPTNPDGTFAEAFKNPLYKKFTISAFDTPNFTANNIHSIEDLLLTFTPPDNLTEVETGIKRIVENLPDWLQKHLLEPEDDQIPLLNDSKSKAIDSLSKPIALNLTKLNLTKPYGTDKSGESSKELSKPQKRQYAIAMDKEREQEARVKKSFERKATKPAPISTDEVEAAYERRTHKR